MVNTWWMNERLNQHVNTDRNATQSREMHSKTCNTKLRWPTFATQNTSLRSNKNKNWWCCAAFNYRYSKLTARSCRVCSGVSQLEQVRHHFYHGSCLLGDGFTLTGWLGILTTSLPQHVQFPGWKMHGRACIQYIFWSHNTSTFNVYVLMKVLSRASAEKKTKRVSNFALLLAVFKWLHGSEGVNTLWHTLHY